MTLTPPHTILKLMDKWILLIIVLVMIGIVLDGMVPAVLTNDPAKVQEAADRTTERLLDFTTDRIIDEVKGLPVKIVTDKLPG